MVDRERFWKGDHEYFEEVLRKYGRVVKAVCLNYGESEDEVDDLVQEIWTLVYVKRRTFRGDGLFSAWLYRIATHHCIDVYRKRKAEKKGLDNFVASGGVEDIHRRPPDAAVESGRNQAKRTLWKALDTLPDKEREAIVARLIEGKSPTEVAEEMKIEKASVRSNNSRGIRRLRGIIGGGEQ